MSNIHDIMATYQSEIADREAQIKRWSETEEGSEFFDDLSEDCYECGIDCFDFIQRNSQ